MGPICQSGYGKNNSRCYYWTLNHKAGTLWRFHPHTVKPLWHDGGPSITMLYHLRRVSDLLCNWKSCLLCYMKDVVLHCSIFFKWNKLVRVRVNIRRTKSQNLNVSRLFSQLALPNPLKPGFKSRMKMWLDRRCSNYIWVINNFFPY